MHYTSLNVVLIAWNCTRFTQVLDKKNAVISAHGFNALCGATLVLGVFNLSLGIFSRRVFLGASLVEDVANIAIQRNPARSEQWHGMYDNTADIVLTSVHQFAPAIILSDTGLMPL